MTDGEIISMLRQDVEQLQRRVEVIPGLEADVRALGREIGQHRKDTEAGFDRLATQLDRVAQATDNARDEARVWMARFGWLIAASALGVILTALGTRALL